MDPVVILGTDSLAVGPGEQARLPVRIRNQSRRVESYRVDVVGAAASFARVDPSTVSVLPGREAELNVTFTPPGGAKAPSGIVPFAVRATSEVESRYSAVAEGTLELAGVAGLQMWAANNAASGRWSGRYQLEFANQGNAGARIAINARDPSAAMRVSVEEPLIDLRPGGRTSTKLKAKARYPFLRGSPVNRQLQVDCRNVPFGALPPEPGMAPDPADPGHRTLQLTFQQKPVLTKLTVLLLVLGIGLLVAFAIFRLRQTEELSLDLTAPEAPPGLSVQPSGSTSVFLQWAAVPNALGYQIRETTNSGEMGSEVAVVDAATRSHAIEELDPGQEYCFAVIAVGPEGAANSAPTAHQCVTTSTPSALAAPDGLVAVPEGGGVFSLQWTHPDTEGVEFAVLVDNTRQPDLVVGLSTRITLPQRETAYDALIAVQALRGEEASDPSAPQTVTVDALPATATTPPPTVAPVTVPGGGTAPTTSAPVAATTTTTTPVTQTTVIVSPARTELQDITATPAAFLGAYRPESQGGLPLEQRRNDLALAFDIPVTDIATFTNRDTRIRDAVDTGGDLGNVSPSQMFFYVARPTAEEAAAVCDRNNARTCGTFTLQGAPSAAEGTVVVVAGRLPATTPLAELDAALSELRAQLGRQTVFALDGGKFEGFSANEIVVFVSDLGTPEQIDQFCDQHFGGTCTTGTLRRLP
jgi:Fibronectin type III domain